MSAIPKQLRELSQHIEDVEQRLARVRANLARLACKTQDTRRAREFLAAIGEALGRLYVQRGLLRRHLWTIGSRPRSGDLNYDVPSVPLPFPMVEAPAPLPPGACA